MTKFEQTGINHLCRAKTKEVADATFERSCNYCCYRNMRIDCDACAIAYCHSMIVAAFAENNTKKECACYAR